MRTKLMTVLLALSIALTLAVADAQASITATLTADNHYGLFVGNGDGSILRMIGRNEVGASDAADQGLYNWSLPETFTFSAQQGDYLYMVAWNDGGSPNAWIGEFTGQGTALYSNVTDWRYTLGSGPNPGDDGAVPDSSVLQNDIADAVWAPLLASAPNGTSPWDQIPGISANADFTGATR